MPTKKQGRVAEQIREILSEIVQFEVADPRLQDMTVMDVEVDRELMVATIYVSALGGDLASESVIDGLESAKGFLRRELGARMSLRRVPELRFKWDSTLSYAAHIDELLDSIQIPPDDNEASASSDTPE
jgi:ribosome-binding factor A